MNKQNQENTTEDNRVAVVELLSINHVCGIEVTYLLFKHVKIYISTAIGNDKVTTFRPSLLKDFMSIIDGYKVIKFTTNGNIANDIVALFESKCSINKSVTGLQSMTNSPLISTATTTTAPLSNSSNSIML